MESAQSSGVTQQDGKGVFNKVLATLVDAAADPNSFANDGDRIQALMAAYTLISRLETPWETVLRLVMGQPPLGATLKVIKDLQLLEKWRDHGNEASTPERLAELVSCDPALLNRLLRHLAANGMLEETSIGVFKPSKFTTALLEPVFGEWINYLYDAVIPTFYKMPEFFAKNGYKNPTDPADGIFQFAKGGYKGNLFQYYDENPREGESFNNVMGGVMANQAGWLDIYPHETLIADAAKYPDRPLVVDVGGNVGHDMERFRRAHPETASRLYLQDRPDVVRLSKCPDPVNKMGYDFFTPQPIKGARVYYMHGVLHDWPDDLARKILEQQRPAMLPGYSKLLVHDHVVPESKANPHATAYDLSMMAMVAGEERTEAHWRRLLADAGYRVLRIWRSPLAAQSIIEAEVAE
ncbi:hypothetical protein VTH82DRAFT_6783 [Thermothelomyces myriococcoides]